jgi:uncharacterized Zn-binding protein involved in type VI secretion
MRGFARVDDLCTGRCSKHKNPITVDGVIVGGSVGSSSDGRAMARVGDLIKANCGHTGFIDSGVSNITSDGIPMARINDTFSGDYTGTIVGGSTTVGIEGG